MKSSSSIAGYESAYRKCQKNFLIPLRECQMLPAAMEMELMDVYILYKVILRYFIIIAVYVALNECLSHIFF